MARVMLDDVRDAINADSTNLPDAKLRKMIKRAEVIVEGETGVEIDYTDCSDKEKECIILIAALAAIAFLSGGASSSMSSVSSFSLGDLQVNSSSTSGSQTSPSAQRFQELRDRALALLASLKGDEGGFRAVTA